MAGPKTAPPRAPCLRERDRDEVARTRQQKRRRRHRDRGGCHHAARLRADRIDQCAGRRLRHDAGHGRDRHHDPDAGLVPFLDGEQIDRQIGPQPVAHVGEEEVGGVEAQFGACRSVDVFAAAHVHPLCV